jgi:micrococcal nuclease
MTAGRFLISIFSCFSLFLYSVPAFAHPVHPGFTTIEGLVVGVSEGDRLTINSFGTEIRVRLYGLAAPQTAKVDKFTGWYKAGQPYAEDAFRALSIKVLHQQVKIQIRKTVIFKGETQQMAVAVVFLDDRNINLEMVAEGWAWAYPKLLERVDHAHYLTAERMARTKKNGLWLQEAPQPPWDFKPQVRIKAKQ